MTGGNFGGSSSSSAATPNSAAVQPQHESNGPASARPHSESVWSASAPPSPVTRWHRNSSIFGGANKGVCSPAPSSARPSAATNPILHDFGGCDFLLLVDKAVDGPSCPIEAPGGTRSSVTANKSVSDAGTSGATMSTNHDADASCNIQKSPQKALKLKQKAPTRLSQQPKSYAIHLVAPNIQEKAAWMSDLSQVSIDACFVLLHLETFGTPKQMSILNRYAYIMCNHNLDWIM